MTLREKQADFWVMASRLIHYAYDIGYPVVVLEWKRDFETQKKYVAIGRSTTYKSKHLDGLAIDVAFLDDILDDGQINYDKEKYRRLGEYWETLEGRWGGRFGVDKNSYGEKIGWDAGHFEYNK